MPQERIQGGTGHPWRTIRAPDRYSLTDLNNRLNARLDRVGAPENRNNNSLFRLLELHMVIMGLLAPTLKRVGLTSIFFVGVFIYIVYQTTGDLIALNPLWLILMMLYPIGTLYEVHPHRENL